MSFWVIILVPDWRKIQGRRIESALKSTEIKNFSFGMFDNETKTVKKFRKNIITVKKMRIRNMERFVLNNEKAIVDKRQNRNQNIEIFKLIF